MTAGRLRLLAERVEQDAGLAAEPFGPVRVPGVLALAGGGDPLGGFGLTISLTSAGVRRRRGTSAAPTPATAPAT